MILRPLFISSFSILCMLVGIRAAADPLHPPRPAPISQGRPSFLPMVCGSCHAVPHPHDLPRKEWPNQLTAMAKLIEQRGMQVTPKMYETLKDYYVGNSLAAPPDLPPDLPPDIDPDAVVGTPFAGRAIGRPVEGFDAAKPMALGNAPPLVANVNVVDLDRDGEPDVLVADSQINTVSWLHKVDGEWIETPLIEPGTFVGPAKTEVFDYDNDGDLDIAVAVLGWLYPSDRLVGKVVVLVNDGLMQFTPVVLLENVPRVADVRPFDLDGDGDWDYAVAMFGWLETGAVGWLEQKGENNVQLHHLARKNGAIHVPVYDLNDDGLPDIIALISQQHEEIVVFLNRGGGRFKAHTLFQALTPTYGSSGIELADLDQDGDQDILYTNGGAMDGTGPKPCHGIQWLENKEELEFVYHDLGRFYGAYRAIARDLDQDGDFDIAVSSLFNKWEQPGRQSLIWLENNGDQTFRRHGIAATPTHLVSIDTADFDGDGLLDILGGGMHALPPFTHLGRLTLWSRKQVDKPAATDASGDENMLELLQTIAQQTADTNSYLGNRRNRELRTQLAVLPDDAHFGRRIDLQLKLAAEELRIGKIESAIALASAAYQKVDSLPNKPGLELVAFRLGMAYMRLGETENCCAINNPDSCVLPFREAALHTNQRGSKKAIEYFTQVVERTADQRRLFRSRWLLNIAYMTIDGYPDDVPKKYLIPPAAFNADEEFPHFTNIAKRLTIDTFNLSGGVVADDFDNDGYLDILTSTWDTKGQIIYFHNNGDGTFSDQTEQAGLTGLTGGLNMVQADYNNDGYIDVLVLRGAWLGPNGQHPNSLLRNNTDGTFTDVTFEADLGEVHYPTQTAAWADYDNDGHIDLYIGNEYYTEGEIACDAPCQLFHNNGDGTFTDLAAAAGVENKHYAKGVVWGDYDGDRFPDLYVSNLRAPNRLYRNNGDGTFSDVAVKLGVSRPILSFPAWFWDYNNDGVLDLYVSSYGVPPGTAELAMNYLGLPIDVELQCLYRGENGGFRNVSKQSGLTRLALPMGANFGDLENDGYPDFYLGTGYIQYEGLMPNVMYRNVAGTEFRDVTWPGGFGQLQKGHGIAFADFDNDGDQEIFAQTGGAYPGDEFFNALYQNPGFGNHWITIKLVGVRSNRAAIGARIRLDVVDDGKERSIYKHVNSGGSFGANPLQQTIGIGKATVIRKVDIFWPTTGETQTFQDVAADQFLRITEGSDNFESLDLKRLEL